MPHPDRGGGGALPTAPIPLVRAIPGSRGLDIRFLGDFLLAWLHYRGHGEIMPPCIRPISQCRFCTDLGLRPTLFAYAGVELYRGVDEFGNPVWIKAILSIPAGGVNMLSPAVPLRGKGYRCSLVGGKEGSRKRFTAERFDAISETYKVDFVREPRYDDFDLIPHLMARWYPLGIPPNIRGEPWLETVMREEIHVGVSHPRLVSFRGGARGMSVAEASERAAELKQLPAKKPEAPQPTAIDRTGARFKRQLTAGLNAPQKRGGGCPVSLGHILANITGQPVAELPAGEVEQPVQESVAGVDRETTRPERVWDMSRAGPGLRKNIEAHNRELREAKQTAAPVTESIDEFTQRMLDGAQQAIDARKRGAA